MQLYFTSGIYSLHGKLTAVWNFTSVKLTEVKFAPKWVSLHLNSSERMWTLIMNSTYTKMKFYPEVKSQTGLSSLRVSCESVLIVNEVLRQPFEIVDIILTQEAAIWRSFAEYMFWGATLRFVIFLEEAFILNLNSLITYVFISFITTHKGGRNCWVHA